MSRSTLAAHPSAYALFAELRYSALFAGLYLALGAQLAFGQVWLEDWGLSASEIGALNVIAVLMRMIAGVALPWLSERTGRPQAVFGVLSALGAVLTAAHFGVETKMGLYALSAALACVFAGLIPLSDAHGFSAAEKWGFSYRRARSVGSFAFLCATLSVGALVDRFDINVMLWWMAASLAIAALAGITAPMQARARHEARPTGVLPHLLRNQTFVLSMACVAALQSSHAVLYIYGSMHWRALGFSETAIGALWAWGVLCEIALFFVGRTAMERLGPAWALILAALAGMARWTLMTLDPNVAGAAALQTLHAFTFGLTHLAAVLLAARLAPPGGQATAQGLSSAVAGGLAMAAAIEAARWAFPLYGGGAYWVSVALSGLGGALALWLLAMRPKI